jgi:hypothetical protein
LRFCTYFPAQLKQNAPFPHRYIETGFEKPEKTITVEEEKKMAETTLPDYPRGITFEQVWAALMEDRENIRKWQEEGQKQREENQKRREEADREFQKLRESMKETDRIIGKLGNRFGELVEHLVAPSIREKFNELHFSFENISENHVIHNAEGRCIAEIDLLLENGDIVIAVEVKAKPLEKDVDEHIGRMEVLRRRADARHDTRKFQGAIAGAIMSEAVRNYAHKTGFYVIEQTGDTVKIANPEGFTPGEW